MAAPQILSSASWGGTVSGTVLRIAMPSGIAAGDVLLALMVSTIDILAGTDPSGWTRANRTRAVRTDGVTDVNAGTLVALTKVASGAETEIISTVATGRHASLTLRLTPESVLSTVVGQATTGLAGAFPNGSAIHPVHPSVSISESREYLMLAPFGFSKNTGFSFTPPTGYGSPLQSVFGVDGAHGYPALGLSSRVVTTGATHSPGSSVLSDAVAADFRWWVAFSLSAHLPQAQGRRNKLMGAM